MLQIYHLPMQPFRTEKKNIKKRGFLPSFLSTFLKTAQTLSLTSFTLTMVVNK